MRVLIGKQTHGVEANCPGITLCGLFLVNVMDKRTVAYNAPITCVGCLSVLRARHTPKEKTPPKWPEGTKIIVCTTCRNGTAEGEACWACGSLHPEADD